MTKNNKIGIRWNFEAAKKKNIQNRKMKNFYILNPKIKTEKQKCIKFDENFTGSSAWQFLDRIRSKGKWSKRNLFSLRGGGGGERARTGGLSARGNEFPPLFNLVLRDYRYRGAWTMRSSCAGASLAMATNGSRDETWKYAGGAPYTATVWSWSSRLEWQTGILSIAAFLYDFRERKLKSLSCCHHSSIPFPERTIYLDCFQLDFSVSTNFISFLRKRLLRK